LTALGTRLNHPHPARRALRIEGVVASRRDPAVAELMSKVFARRRQRLATMIGEGQARDDIDSSLSSETVARFLVTLGLGALLMSSLDQGEANEGEWEHLIATLVNGLRPH
jgi:hypothetical protein